MRTFLRRLTRANQVLLSLFLVLAGLALWQWQSYQPWSRQYMRTSFDDAYGFPMYVDEVDFWPGRSGLGDPGAETFVLGPPGIDSTGERADTPMGTWNSGRADVQGYPLPLPTELAVRYTSVTEKRSYAGRVPLPRARFDSLLAVLAARPALFESLYSYPTNQPGFELQAGLGPGGLVVVWLKGKTGEYQAEVVRAHVPPVPTVWPKGGPADNPMTDPGAPARSFAELRRQVARVELAHLDSFPHTSPALLDSLARRYRYRLRVQGPLASPTLAASFLDNEMEPLPAPAGQAGLLHRAVPDAMQYEVTGAGLATHQRSTVFEPTETRRAFAQVQASCGPGEVPELLLLTLGENVRVQLRSRRRVVELQRVITYVGPE